jgi:hypothetical protein
MILKIQRPDLAVLSDQYDRTRPLPVERLIPMSGKLDQKRF